MDELKEIVINLFIKKKLKRHRLKKLERKGKYNEKEVRSTSGSSRYHGSAGTLAMAAGSPNTTRRLVTEEDIAQARLPSLQV